MERLGGKGHRSLTDINNDIAAFNALMEKSKSSGKIVALEVEEWEKKHKVRAKLNAEQTNEEERQYSNRLRGIDMVARAEAKYQAELHRKKKEPTGVEEATFEYQRLEAEKQRLLSETGPFTPERDQTRRNEALRVEDALQNQLHRIEAARYDDARKLREEQRRKNEELQKELGMLSDEDMLKARIIAGEMRRGEIKKEMNFSEFALLPKDARQWFDKLGGKVTGTPFGLGGNAEVAQAAITATSTPAYTDAFGRRHAAETTYGMGYTDWMQAQGRSRSSASYYAWQDYQKDMAKLYQDKPWQR